MDLEFPEISGAALIERVEQWRVPSSKYAVRVKSEADRATVDQLWEMEAQLYGSETIVEKETLLQFWHAYPRGLTTLYVGDVLVGGTAIWPIKTDVFWKILASEIEEKEFRPTDISPDSPYFYFGDIILQPSHQNFAFAALLLREALMNWWASSPFLRNYMCALTYSDSGASIAKKLGLKAQSKSSIQHQVFSACIVR